ncbi:unnamed protein product [Coregonus sp. 'balchen']|nr:unnamed protein product [Coregonus sp. 'balchen']
MILEEQTLILRLIETGQQNGAEYAIEEGLLPLKDQQCLQSLVSDLQGADLKLRNPITSRASERDVESVMKKWLQLAADREGERKRRARSVESPVP